MNRSVLITIIFVVPVVVCSFLAYQLFFNETSLEDKLNKEREQLETTKNVDAEYLKSIEQSFEIYMNHKEEGNTEELETIEEYLKNTINDYSTKAKDIDSIRAVAEITNKISEIKGDLEWAIVLENVQFEYQKLNKPLN